MKVDTQFQVEDVVTFHSLAENDPFDGSTVVVTAINPAELLFPGEEHYRIFVPAMNGESYALATELRRK